MSDFQNKTDKELVLLSLENPDHFYHLMKRYEGRLMRYILRISNIDKPLAEDILQEVFIKAYRNLNDYDDDFAFSTWIYRITHNQVIDQVRKNDSRLQSISLDDEEAQEFIDILPDSIDLEKEYKKKELSVKVRTIIDRLPQHYREVLVLRYLEDQDYEAMSDILQKPIGTIGTLLNRAKEQFKQAALNQSLS